MAGSRGGAARRLARLRVTPF
ncbi:hypothetical protein CBM2634_A10061 [Cupriavidus taiwanensis]|uniref:Uncharacterized protein n=1 Tax=Cupriavidus taiwanensis TaxID=164546 RepID=A0A375ITG5_9BURK|nr:hypothetical protein CBM2634_A10061 [Cupriavidus taiwanensis]